MLTTLRTDHEESVSQALPSSDNPISNTFLTYVGLLATVALPMVIFFMGGYTVTREANLRTYMAMVVALFLLFLALYWLGERILQRWPEETRQFHAAYVTLVMPCICILLSLTVAHKVALFSYSRIVLLLYLVFLLVWWFGRKRILATPIFNQINTWIVYLMPLAYSFIFWSWFYLKYRPATGVKIGRAHV